MNPQQQSRLFANCPIVVLEVGSVRGSHLHQPGATAAHHVGDSESPSDLYELATRDDHLPALCQGVKHQKDRSRIVVYNKGRLSPGQGAKDLLHMDIARSSLSLFQIVFQVGKMAGDLFHLVDCATVQERPSQVGMNDHPRCIDDPPEATRDLPVDSLSEIRHQRFHGKHRPIQDSVLGESEKIPSETFQTRTNGRYDDVSRVRIDPLRNTRISQYVIDLGDLAEELFFVHHRISPGMPRWDGLAGEGS